MIEKGIISFGKIVGAIVLIVSAGYGIYTFVYSLGADDANKNYDNKEINIKLSKVISFQERDSIKSAKTDKKIDSLVIVFGGGLKQISYMKVSQDSLKAYFIRKAVTKQDLQEVMRIFDNEKKKQLTDSMSTIKHSFKYEKIKWKEEKNLQTNCRLYRGLYRQGQILLHT